MSTKTIVMSRVHAIHAMRPFVNASAFGCVVVLGALLGIGHEVWVAKVLQNMPSLTDISAVTRFFLAAFMNTSFLVQALTLAILSATVLLARESARMLGGAFKLQQASL